MTAVAAAGRLIRAQRRTEEEVERSAHCHEGERQAERDGDAALALLGCGRGIVFVGVVVHGVQTFFSALPMASAILSICLASISKTPTGKSLNCEVVAARR